jgi:transposase
MALYCGMDLHSTNTWVFIGDDQDHPVVSRRIPNRLESILEALEPHRNELAGIAIESTFNWYWLVDGLMDHGHRVQLVNPSAVQQYKGLKFTDDRHDARWLAHLLRLGLLPTGYIYPQEDRPVRDLLRKRSKLVQQRTSNYQSVKNLMCRNTGEAPSRNAMKAFEPEQVREVLGREDLSLAVETTLAVIETINVQIDRLETLVLERAVLRDDFRILRTIPGVGKVLGLLIMYETGEIGRFPSAGNYASYCRCVPATRTSNFKNKGAGNRKNGNAYLSWAFSEAAHFARRFQPRAKSFYDRKAAKTKLIIAARALAHKLAKATFFMLRDQVPYDAGLLFR